jgi:NADH-quinone oxidoreductase subunit A
MHKAKAHSSGGAQKRKPEVGSLPEQGSGAPCRPAPAGAVAGALRACNPSMPLDLARAGSLDSGVADKYVAGVGSQLWEYVPVLILIAVVVALTAGMLILSVVAGKVGRRPQVKDTAYECGMTPVGEGHARFHVKFYLVAMLFILFDIEVVFLYPWAVVYRKMLADPATRNLVFLAMLTFIGIVLVGYLYAFKKRAFDWLREA